MIQLDGASLRLEDLDAVARGRVSCRLSESARAGIRAARGVLESALRDERPIYGANTGFGRLSDVVIPTERLTQLQERLVLSHAAGVGEPLPDAVVRVMLVLRANTLARGHSGCRVRLVERILELLNRNLLPSIPSRGSVGASGDLAPLAHLALPIIGRGRLRRKGELLPAAEALRREGLEPLALEAKEGLALVNGTQGMTALLAIAACEGRELLRWADVVGALSLDAVRGSDEPFDPRLQRVRPYPGQSTSAANLRRLIEGSEIREAHRRGDSRVQDPYSFRCMPQVHGSVRDVLADVETKLAVEINSVTDNPLIFADDGAVIAGGNFHGQPMAMAADFLAIALSELASISERRIEKLNQHEFSGLPSFLVEEPGVNSGFMVAQVTAAALVSENKGLAHPASVDSIPTSADKEDHVSMGMGAALKLGRVVVNVRQVLAIELLAAAQGIDLLRPLKTSPSLERVHRELRSVVERWDEDREMAPDLAVAESFLQDSAVTASLLEGVE